MAIDIYSTTTMMQAIAQNPPVTSFLKNRYFPTNPSTDIFSTHDVLIDIKEGSKKMAPVVMPRKKGITMAREAFRTERWTPPLVSPQKTLTVDDLQKRDMGEALYSGLTPEQREGALLGKDLIELEELHVNREEYIAAKCMIDNGYVLTQYADDYGNVGEEYEIHFYEEDSNPSTYIPPTQWSDPTANILGDIGVMARMLTTKGNNVGDFIAAPDVIDAMINNEKIQKLLDNRSMQIGEIKIEEMEGASYYGRVSAAGKSINLISYEAVFEDDLTGEVKPLFESGQGVLTAEGAGRAMYGAMTQLEKDEKYHTYSAQRIPKTIVDVANDVKTVRVAAKPLFTPKSLNPWVSGKFL